ncbi:TetR family transcriptional regulator [Anaerocolumna sedimenticola]|uniref:TetR family transcriptional regulator n=1 Tax=Anaerocolumna sedimenticola TaxID=2696063 RepID=A0A6P1TNL4_9FIRM|nr:TetR/AcrR family transcriptional regulator [Anaerocolumna sedimenticola]QHQ62820.1 TetR family transcriptional regulator [Anaerocolumna sedimenticola]
MARNKYPEITRARILEAAQKLFMEKGWEETTVQDIVDELADVTRGAFYHHFQSKDDIIDAVTTQMFSGDVASLIEENANLNVNGLNKLRNLLAASLINEGQLQFVKIAPSVLQSPIFIGKQIKDCVKSIAPHICECIEEGNQDGSVNVDNPKQAAETFILLANLWLNPITFTVTKEEYRNKISHVKSLFHGIGLPVINDELFGLFEKYYDYVVQNG